MSALARIALASALGLTSMRGAAAGPAEDPVDADAREIPADDQEALERARAAWEDAKWGETRRILEPLAADPDRLEERRIREQALAILADATISDASLDEAGRRRIAGAYLERLLDEEPSWRLPPGIYSPELSSLFLEIQEARSRTIDETCRADLMVCRSERETDKEEHRVLQRKYEQLQEDYAEQEVEVRTQVTRSRFLAAIPFGFGHFYNGGVGGPNARRDRALGGTFLAAEVVFGGAGLTLLLYRVLGDGCRRTRSFQSGSLQCSGNDRDAIGRRRRAEEAMAWLFVGSVALDIVLAQVFFQKYETVDVDRVKRRELESGEPAGPEQAPRRRSRRKGPRAKVRPTGAVVPQGVGLGVRVSF